MNTASKIVLLLPVLALIALVGCNTGESDEREARSQPSASDSESHSWEYDIERAFAGEVRQGGGRVITYRSAAADESCDPVVWLDLDAAGCRILASLDENGRASAPPPHDNATNSVLAPSWTCDGPQDLRPSLGDEGVWYLHDAELEFSFGADETTFELTVTNARPCLSQQAALCENDDASLQTMSMSGSLRTGQDHGQYPCDVEAEPSPVGGPCGPAVHGLRCVDDGPFPDD